MFKRKSIVFAVIMCLAAPIVLFYSNGFSSEAKSKEEPAVSGVKLGAHLYDNWPKIKGIKPEGNHPLYPATSKKKGIDTFRCKECHGWDYIGKDGRYAKGSHYTGIIGVMAASGKDEQSIKKALTSGESKHDFSQYLSDTDLDALVAFIKKGLVDVLSTVDAKGIVKGDAVNGCNLFGQHCADCHGDNGQIFDFKKKKDGIQGVGWLARDNPQETFHKIRWGHPGAEMPSIQESKLTEKDAADILAHSQTLAQ